MLKTSMWAILGRPVNLRPPSLKTNWARQWVEGGHDWIFTIPQFSSFVNFHELSQANPHPRFPPQCMDCVRCMCFLIDVSSLLWECPLDSGKCSEQFFWTTTEYVFLCICFLCCSLPERSHCKKKQKIQPRWHDWFFSAPETGRQLAHLWPRKETNHRKTRRKNVSFSNCTHIFGSSCCILFTFCFFQVQMHQCRKTSNVFRSPPFVHLIHPPTFAEIRRKSMTTFDGIIPSEKLQWWIVYLNSSPNQRYKPKPKSFGITLPDVVCFFSSWEWNGPTPPKREITLHQRIIVFFHY